MKNIQILFAYIIGSKKEHTNTVESATEQSFLMLIISFGIFLLITLGAIIYLAYFRSLCETLEAESALIAREYLKNKPILINYLNGVPDFDKPPLFYWLIAIFAKIIPSWELAARMPSILAIFIFLILFFYISKRLLKKSIEFFILWSFIFLACPKIFWMAQVARMDLFFSSICFLSLFFFLKLIKEFKEKKIVSSLSLLFYFFFTAISVMIKGPLGAIIVFIPSIIYLFIYEDLSLIRKIFINRYIFIFIITAIPWYIYATIKTDFSFFNHFFLQENLSRFTNLIPNLNFKEFNHSPSHRYIVYILIGFFPWSLLIPFWLFNNLPLLKKKDFEIEKIFFIYLLFVFIFFTLSLSKRSDYVLPIYPVLSFFTALLFFDYQNGKKLFSRLYKIVGFLIIIISLFAINLIFKIYSIDFISKIIDLSVLDYLKDIFELYKINIFCLLILGILISFKKFHKIYIIFLFASILFLLILSPLNRFYSGKDLRGFCQKISPIIKDQNVFFIGFWDEQSVFYLDKQIKKINFKRATKLLLNKKEKLFFLVDEKRLKKLIKAKIPLKIIAKSNSPLFPIFLISSS